MKNAKFELLRFDSADVIATSATLHLGLWGSGYTWGKLDAMGAANFNKTPTEGAGFAEGSNYQIRTNDSFDKEKVTIQS